MKSKLICNTFFVLMLSLSSLAVAENVRINDDNIPFLYESRAEIKAPEHKLAGYISTDYRKAKDEFTKHDLFEQIKPIIDKRLGKAKKTEKIFLRIGGKLGEYDFKNKSFSTGFSTSSFIPFKNGYAVVFINANNIESIPVPIKSARNLSGQLRKNRQTTYIIYGDIVGTKEKQLNWKSDKAVEVKITKIEVKLRSGTIVGTKAL